MTLFYQYIESPIAVRLRFDFIGFAEPPGRARPTGQQTPVCICSFREIANTPHLHKNRDLQLYQEKNYNIGHVEE